MTQGPVILEVSLASGTPEYPLYADDLGHVT
jgi:hypothetical protein